MTLKQQKSSIDRNYDFERLLLKKWPELMYIVLKKLFKVILIEENGNKSK